MQRILALNLQSTLPMQWKKFLPSPIKSALRSARFKISSKKYLFGANFTMVFRTQKATFSVIHWKTPLQKSESQRSPLMTTYSSLDSAKSLDSISRNTRTTRSAYWGHSSKIKRVRQRPTKSRTKKGAPTRKGPAPKREPKRRALRTKMKTISIVMTTTMKTWTTMNNDL